MHQKHTTEGNEVGPGAQGAPYPMAPASLLTTMYHTSHCSGASFIYSCGWPTLLNEHTHQNRIPLLLPPSETEREVPCWQEHIALVRSWITASSVRVTEPVDPVSWGGEMG